MTKCRSLVKLVENLWKEYGDIAKQVGCTAVGGGAAGGNPAAAVSARLDCLEKIDQVEKVAREIGKRYDSIVGRTSSLTVGPRQLPIGAWQRGTVVGPGDRMFITAEPMDTDEMRVRLIERGGKGRVGIAICALAENGDEDELADFEWNENRSERRDDSQSLSRRFHGVRGRWIVVKLDGKSVAKRFRYKLRLDA